MVESLGSGASSDELGCGNSDFRAKGHFSMYSVKNRTL